MRYIPLLRPTLDPGNDGDSKVFPARCAESRLRSFQFSSIPSDGEVTPADRSGGDGRRGRSPPARHARTGWRSSGVGGTADGWATVRPTIRERPRIHSREGQRREPLPAEVESPLPPPPGPPPAMSMTPSGAPPAAGSCRPGPAPPVRAGGSPLSDRGDTQAERAAPQSRRASSLFSRGSIEVGDGSELQ